LFNGNVRGNRTFAPIVLVVAGLLVACTAYAQRETVIQPSQETSQYGRRFFTQLRTVFGRFRETDLERVFENAKPIQCSELINENGEWRTVAFFNEKRELGDWYRSNFEEVKSDLSVFIFKGVCRSERALLQLTTKFPVTESIEAYNGRNIGLDDVEVNVNAPVRASFDNETEAYTFDLPYLFVVGEKDGETIYSLQPPRLAERRHYATDVTNHWACKSVTADNVTYRFLICRTNTQPRLMPARNQAISGGFGSSAYFILSDGREASSSVKLSFGDPGDAPRSIEDNSVADDTATEKVEWTIPDSSERLVTLLREEFRIRFNPQSWAGRTAAAQGLAGREISDLASFNPAPSADSCVWIPGPARNVAGPAAYEATIKDGDLRSSTSITFRMTTSSGALFGSLQCFFPRSTDAASLTFGRWASIVGSHLTLEVH
jgi:hypothetical protein